MGTYSLLHEFFHAAQNHKLCYMLKLQFAHTSFEELYIPKLSFGVKIFIHAQTSFAQRISGSCITTKSETFVATFRGQLLVIKQHAAPWLYPHACSAIDIPQPEDIETFHHHV